MRFGVDAESFAQPLKAVADRCRRVVVVERIARLQDQLQRIERRIPDLRLGIDREPRLPLRGQHVAGMEVVVQDDAPPSPCAGAHAALRALRRPVGAGADGRTRCCRARRPAPRTSRSPLRAARTVRAGAGAAPQLGEHVGADVEDRIVIVEVAERGSGNAALEQERVLLGVRRRGATPRRRRPTPGARRPRRALRDAGARPSAPPRLPSARRAGATYDVTPPGTYGGSRSNSQRVDEPSDARRQVAQPRRPAESDSRCARPNPRRAAGRRTRARGRSSARQRNAGEEVVLGNGRARRVVDADERLLAEHLAPHVRRDPAPPRLVELAPRAR